MLALWLKQHLQSLRVALFAACCLPALLLLLQWHSQSLGPNPLSCLMHTTGRSALMLLAASLAITPLRRWCSDMSRFTHRRYGKRLADWNWLIRLRRMLGLWSFAYALVHVALYLHFDLGYDWAGAWDELQQKPYLLAGLCAFALLIPLAATSSQAMKRRLGRNWRRLHQLSYVVAVLGLLHFWWSMKPGLYTPWPETLALTALLGYRAALAIGLLQRWDGFDGTESAPRDASEVRAGQAQPHWKWTI